MRKYLFFVVFEFIVLKNFSQSTFINNEKIKILGDTYINICGDMSFTNNISGNLEIRGNFNIQNSLNNLAGCQGIHLISDSIQDASLLHFTPNVPATVERFLQGKRYHYISSPITSATTGTANINTRQFYQWDASQQWLGLGDYLPWGNSYNGLLDICKGYAYSHKPQTIAFEGNINVDNYTLQLYNAETGIPQNQGWNLLGNPYSTCLNWDLMVAENPSPYIEKTIYYFDDDNSTGAQSNYRYYIASGSASGVGTNDATQYIPLGQGFFIKSNKNNEPFQIRTSQRVQQKQTFYKKRANENNTIRCKISGYQSTDEMVIRFLDEASKNFDFEYDARKLFPQNSDIPMIFSITEDNILSPINSIPFPEKTDSMEICIEAKTGEYKLQFEQNLDAEYLTYFIDKQENICTRIDKISNFFVSHYGGRSNNRFYLLFTKEILTISNIAQNSDINFFVNNNDKSVIIKSKCFPVKFELIDVMGRLVFISNLFENQNSIDISKCKPGFYIARITSNSKIIKEEKIVLN